MQLRLVQLITSDGNLKGQAGKEGMGSGLDILQFQSIR